MKFNEAYLIMRAGSLIALPEWKGYWYWDKTLKTIIIHTSNGTELDIRETDDVSYTFSFICREDWIIIGE